MNDFQVTERVVAIVCFGFHSGNCEGFQPGRYYQVTIDPASVSPSGQFVRFGNFPGDEITGWQRCAAMSVLEILGKWDGDKAPVLHYGEQGVVPMMAPLMIENGQQ